MAAKKKKIGAKKVRRTKKSTTKASPKVTGKRGAKAIIMEPPKRKATMKKRARKPKASTKPKSGMGVPTQVGSDDKPAVVVNPPSDD